VAVAWFTEDVTVVNHLSGRVHAWELCEPMTFRLVDADDAEVVTVPPKFVTDFASVPRPFWFVISPWGRHGRAAIVHDFLYQLGGVTHPAAGTMRRPSKTESDRLFRKAMGALDQLILGKKRVARLRLALAWPRRWVMWTAVALFGHRAYKREQSKGTAPPLEHEMLEDVERQVRVEQESRG
jgi:hypothetical protein